MTAEKFIGESQVMSDLTQTEYNTVLNLMEEYARIKCLEAIKNTRYKSIEIVGKYYSMKETGEGECALIQKNIQNIPNEDVIPEL